jgi:hypothetical protein
MKKIALLSLVIGMSIGVYAQSARDEMIPFNKANVQGVCILTDYDAAITTKALQIRMEQDLKLKGSNQKGFRYYPAQPFPEFGSLNYDIYTQVTTVGKKGEQKTAIYLLVCQGNENFVTIANAPELFEKMKNFLNNFMPYLKEYDLDQKILEQTKLIEKLDKEHKSLISDRDKLKKQIEDKEKAILTKEDDLSKANTMLNDLKSSK